MSKDKPTMGMNKDGIPEIFYLSLSKEQIKAIKEAPDAGNVTLVSKKEDAKILAEHMKQCRERQ